MKKSMWVVDGSAIVLAMPTRVDAQSLTLSGQVVRASRRRTLDQFVALFQSGGVITEQWASPNGEESTTGNGRVAGEVDFPSVQNKSTSMQKIHISVAPCRSI